MLEAASSRHCRESGLKVEDCGHKPHTHKHHKSLMDLLETRTQELIYEAHQAEQAYLICSQLCLHLTHITFWTEWCGLADVLA